MCDFTYKSVDIGALGKHLPTLWLQFSQYHAFKLVKLRPTLNQSLGDNYLGIRDSKSQNLLAESG